MKILVVEDSLPSIESAKSQLVPNGHELRIRTEAQGVEKSDFEWADLVLTDMMIPRGGINQSRGPSLEEIPPNTLVPAGLVIVLGALAANTPVIMVTDSNGHHDVLGLLLESLVSHVSLPWVKTDMEMRGRYGLFERLTRPEWVEVAGGKGKDWLHALNLFKRMATKKEFAQGHVDLE